MHICSHLVYVTYVFTNKSYSKTNQQNKIVLQFTLNVKAFNIYACERVKLKCNSSNLPQGRSSTPVLTLASLRADLWIIAYYTG